MGVQRIVGTESCPVCDASVSVVEVVPGRRIDVACAPCGWCLHVSGEWICIKRWFANVRHELELR